MTAAELMMPDSVNVNDLPAGFPAYLGYTDGDFQTANALRGMFPGAYLVLLTVTGATGLAHGARVAGGEDTEPGDLTAAAAMNWLIRALEGAAAPAGAARPVLYASVKGVPGYGMRDILDGLDAFRVRRDEVRLLSAHYTDSPHICGPHSCAAIDIDMDGTQWTNSYRTKAGALIDMSMLRADFFGAAPAPVPVLTETERLVRELGIVRQGDKGEAVKTVQGLCNARAVVIGPLRIDGVFGPQTATAVRAVQSRAGLTVDGIAGPQTWPVLLGVA